MIYLVFLKKRKKCELEFFWKIKSYPIITAVLDLRKNWAIKNAQAINVLPQTKKNKMITPVEFSKKKNIIYKLIKK